MSDITAKLREVHEGFDITTNITNVSSDYKTYTATSVVTLLKFNDAGEAKITRKLTSIGTGKDAMSAEDAALTRALNKLGL